MMVSGVVIGGCWLTGMLLIAALEGADVTWRRPFIHFPEAFAVGAVIGHLHFLALSWLGVVPLWSYALPAGLLVAAIVFWRRRLPSVAGEPCASGAPLRVILPGIIALQLLILIPSFGVPLFDWDARILWGFKAKLLAADGTLVSDAFRDPYRLHIHPRYPLLVPWLTALCATAGSGDIEGGLRLVVQLFGVVTLWQLVLVLWRRHGAVAAIVLGGVLTGTATWLYALFWLQIEVVLAAFLLLAICRVGCWLEHDRQGDLLLAALFLAGAIFTKNEGVLSAFLLPLALLVSAVPHSKLRDSASAGGRLALMTLFLTLPWFFHRAAIPAVSDENYLGQMFSSAGLERAVSRLFEVPPLLAGILFDINSWHLFWVVVLPLAVWSLWPHRHGPRLQRLTASVVCGYLAGIAVVYLFSPWREIAMQIDVSCQRILLPLLPLGLLLCGEWWRSKGTGR